MLKIEEATGMEDSPVEKSVIPFQSGGDQQTSLPVAPPIVQKKGEEFSGNESFSSGVHDKDAEMGKVEMEKRMALIKAWEDNEKTKAENRAYKNTTLVDSWEERKKATLELSLKRIEEKLEKTKAEYQEQKKNKVAELHKAAQEKRAAIEARCGRNIVEIAGKADRFRATGQVPRKFTRCFSSIGC